ncbi:MAG: hypothetical protein QOI81_2054, partial [Actinomycetota bacterium]|nr:hypothetical protein [Actinomycetota bacterium]
MIVRYLMLRSVAVLAMALLLVVGLAQAAAAAPTTYYVNNTSAACNNSGPATQAVPLCTIGAGASKAHAGDTVQVLAGTYNERVAVGASGTSSLPLVFDASSPSVQVTGGTNGFSMSGRSYITISDFTISGTSGPGIDISSSNHITIQGLTVTTSGHPSSGSIASGISLKGTTASSVLGNTTANNTDGGIYLNSSSSGNLIQGNVSYGNARQYTRAAPGLDIRGSGNTVAKNLVYQNEDSGMQFYNGANNNVAIDNVAWGNGDHGIDNLSSTGTTIVSNTVYLNTTAGINVEGTSTGATIRNNISMDNALSNSFGQKGNIRVDANSTSGSSMDRDLVFLSQSGTMFKWGSSSYSSISALRSATGQETSGIQADPKFKSASGHDFHLLAGSPAIDSADSGAPSQPSTDFSGVARVDDPATSNTGTGPRAFDDRGAYEFQPSPDSPPIAALTVTPNSGIAPLNVTADASASTDTDSTPISTYTFSWGDGTAATGPQAGATAPHTFTTAGTYTVTVTVKDTAGLSSTATKSVTVSPDAPPSAALSVTPNSGTAPLNVTADASASTDTDSTPISTYTFSWGDGTAATGPQAGATAPHTYSAAGTFTVTVTVKDTAGLSSTATKSVTVSPDAPPNASLTVTPNAGIPPLDVTADASASTDTDGTPIATYAFDWGDGTAATGPQTGATAPHTFTAVGTYTVTVTVKDTAGLSSTATKTVAVSPDAAPNATLSVTPNSGVAPLNVTADASASTDTDATPISTYTFDWGDGTLATGPQAGATAPHTYLAIGTYTVTVTVKDT